MPLPAHYISSVLISFSTYLERTRVPEAEKTEARRLLQALLDQKADIECWEAKDVESFVSTHSVFSPVAIATVTRFIEKFPPFQVCVYLNQFLLALADDGCSNSTIRNYRSDINQFWLFAKTTDLSKLLNKTVMAHFVANEQAKGLQASSIRRKVAAISQFGLWARRMDIISTDLAWMNNPQLLEELQQPSAISHSLEKTTAKHLKTDAPKTASKPVVAPMVPLIPPVVAAPTPVTPAGSAVSQEALPIQASTLPTARKTQEHRAQLKQQLDELSHRLRRQSQRMVAPWLTLAAIGLFFLGLGVFGYQQLILNAPRPLAYPNAPVAPNRVLSFQGRLTDTAQNPLTTATDMSFKLYDDENAGNVLWDSGTCSITPDQDGIFNSALGSTCGAAIPASVFSENSNVWLEVSVESETLTPRQPIWTVPYALNSETIQGYPISASGAATANTVVTMDGSGDLVLGEVSPEIRSTSGNFTITGQSLLLQTRNNGNIILDADGTGATFIRDYLSAPGATLSATYAGGVPLVLRGGPSGSANILEVQDNSGSTLSSFSSTGNLTVGPSAGTTAAFAFIKSNVDSTYASLTAAGSGSNTTLITPYIFRATTLQAATLTTSGTNQAVLIDPNGTGAINFHSTSNSLDSSGNLTLSSLNTPGGIIYAQTGGLLAATAAGNTDDCLLSAGAGTPTWGSCAGAVSSSIPWQVTNGTANLKNTTLDLLVGGNSTASAKFSVLNINSGVPTASIAGTTTGAGLYMTGEGTITTTRNRSLLLNPDGGYVGIGISNPLAKLHIDTGTWESLFADGAIDTKHSNGNIYGRVGILSDGLYGMETFIGYDMRFKTNATERLRIVSSTGYVGIGTTTPRALLDVAGSASFSGTLAFRGTTDPKIDILNAENFGIRTSPGGDAGLTERFTILNNGQVGIGTTAPVTAFNVRGSSTTASGSAIIAGYDYTTGGVTGHRRYFPGENASNMAGLTGLGDVGNILDIPTISTYGSVGLVGSSSFATGGRTQVGVYGHAYFGQTTGGNTGNNARGGYFLARLTGAVTDFAGSLYGTYSVGDSRGGTQTAGNIYGSYSEGLGETNNRVIGGYFTASGGTTNYGVYSNAGINYFNGPVTVGNVSPTGLLEVSGSPWLSGNALAILNQNGSGNILVASSAGVTRAVITNNGSLGIGTSSPSQALHVVGNAYFDTSAGELTIQNTGSSSVELYGSGSLLFDTAAAQSIGFEVGNSRIATMVNGNFGIGTTTPGGFFSVGSTSQFQVNSSGAITAATGITSSGTITFSGFSSNGGLLYTNGSGVLAQTAVGSSGECLLSAGGGSPTWSSCSTAVESSIPWQVTNGTANLKNTTLDLLVGGNSTASAKFAFLNVNSGTPTASIAGTTTGAATYITGEGTITTTNNRSLLLNPNGGGVGIGTTSATGKLHIAGNTASGNPSLLRLQTTDNASNANMLELRNSTGGLEASLSYDTVGGRLVVQRNGSTANSVNINTSNITISSTGSQDSIVLPQSGAINSFNPKIYLNRANGRISIDTSVADSGTAILADISSANALTTSGAKLLSLKNNAVEKAYIDKDGGAYFGGNVGIGTTTAGSLLTVGSSGGFTVDTSGAISAATGITSSGTITFSGLNTAGGIVYTDGSGVLGTSAAGTTDDCLLSGGTGAPTWGSCAGAVSSSILWQESAGTAQLKNTSLDLLVGGNSTASAKAAFLNINSGTPTASLSAGTSGATFLTANGFLSTTSRQDLVIGNSSTFNTTGSVFINPNGTGNVGIGTTTTTSGYKLDVEGNVRASQTVFADGGSYAAFNAAGTIIGNSGIGAGGAVGYAGGSVTALWAGSGMPLALGTNGTEYVRITSTGNVGIGTTTPIGKFQITGVPSAGGNALAIFNSTNSGSDIFTASASGTNRFVITHAGYVGIGTTSPSHALSVATGTAGFGTTNAGAMVNVRSATSATGTPTEGAAAIRINRLVDDGGAVTNSSGAIEFGNASVRIYRSSNSLQLQGYDQIAFYNTNYGVERARITDLGLFGLGTTSPQSRLDVQGGYAGKAAVTINQTNTGDIFTASDSGTTRFVITEAGNVGIGTSIPSYPLSLTSSNSTLAYFDGRTATNFARVAVDAAGNADSQIVFQEANSARWTIGNDGSDSDKLKFQPTGGAFAGSEVLTLTSTGELGIGTSSPASMLSVGANSEFQVNSSGAIAAATGITSSGTITFSGFSNNGGLLYTDGSGVLAQTAVGSSGECLLSAGGGSPTWGACSDAVGGVVPWEVQNGAANLKNTTLDMLVGGTSSASAKFAFLNVNSGTPTASIAGTTTGAATYITGEGTIATANNRSLLLNPNGGNVGIGTTAPSTKIDIYDGSNANIRLNPNMIDHSTPFFNGRYAGNNTLEIAFNDSGATNNWGRGALFKTPTGGRGFTFAYPSNADFRLAGTTSTDSVRFLVDGAGNVGIGTTTPLSRLDIQGGYAGNAAVTINQINTGDIFTASDSGTTRFVITEAGNVGIGTTTPGEKLAVNGNILVSDRLAHLGSAGSYLDFGDGVLSSFNSLNIRAGNSSGDEGESISFSKYGSSTAVMYIDTHNGEVGIGTTSPASMLSVGANSEFQVNSSGAIAAATGITSSGTITFSDLNTAGGVVYTDGSGVLASVAGSSGECLISNGSSAPSWGSCSASATNYWRLNNGAFSTVNDTADLLIGSNATASAKFAFLNVNSGTPTASIAGTTTGAATYITGEGTIATTNNRSLLINPNGGRVGIGTTNPVSNLEVPGSTSNSSAKFGSYEIQSFAVNNAWAGENTYYNGSGFTARSTGFGTLQYMSNGGFSIRTAPSVSAGSAQTFTERFTILQAGNIGIGTPTPVAKFEVNGTQTAGSNALAIFNQTGTGDIFTASDSGTTRLALTETGELRVGSGTAGSPTYSFLSDTDSGIFSAGANTVGITVGGSERLRIDGSNSIIRSYGYPIGTDTGLFQGVGGVSAVLRAGTTNIVQLQDSGSNVRLHIAAGGNVGIGTTTPVGKFEVNGTQLAGSNALAIFNQTGTGDIFTASDSGTTRFVITENGSIGIGTALPVEDLHLLTSGRSSVLVDTSGNSDADLRFRKVGVAEWILGRDDTDGAFRINPAAALGSSTGISILTGGNVGIGTTTPSSLLSVGATSQFQVNSSGAIAAATGITSSGTITFSGLNTAGGVVYTDGSGVLASVAGSSGQCLTSNGSSAPSWGSCAAGATNYWEMNNGALFPVNATADVLIGGTATSSAKFAFLNVNSGTPTASIAGTTTGAATYITGEGTIATTMNQSLLLNPNGGRVGIGTSSPAGKLHIAGDEVRIGTSGTPTYATGDGDLYLSDLLEVTGVLRAEGDIYADDNIFGPWQVGSPGTNSIGFYNSSTDYASWYLENSWSNLISSYNNGLRLGTDDLGDIQFVTRNTNVMRIAETGNVGIGTTDPIGKLEVTGQQGAGSNALAIFNQTGTGDIFTASDSGTTRFVITEAGNVGIGTTSPTRALDIVAPSTTAFRITRNTSSAMFLDIRTGDYGAGNGAMLYAPNLAFTSDGSTPLVHFGGNGHVGIGDVSPASMFTVGSGDLFQVNSSGAIAAATGITSSGTITFSGLNTAGGVVYTNGSGVLASVAGSVGECLISNGSSAPSWGNCSSGAGLSKWNITSGALTPINTTTDLLIGGTSTASAKFAFINVAGGTPTASIAGTTTGAATYITGEGTIATTNNRSLLLNPNGGNVGVGTTAPLAKLDLFSSTTNSDVQRWMATDGSRLGRFTETSGGAGWFEVDNASGTAQWLLRGDGGNSYVASGNFGIGSTSPTALLDVAGNASLSGTLSFRGTTDPKIDILNGESFGIRTGSHGEGGVFERFTVTNAGNVGIGTSVPLSRLHVVGSSGTDGGITVRESGNNYGGEILGTNSFGNNGGLIIKGRGNSSSGITILSDAAKSINLAPGRNTVGTLLPSQVATTYLVAADGFTDIARWTNSSGTSLGVIANSGGFGIGTTAPAAKLQVTGTANMGGNALAIFDQTGTGDIFTASDSGTTRFVITEAGNVGIGTTSPTTMLEIAATGANTFGPGLTLRNSSTGVTASNDPILGEINFGSSDISGSEDGIGAKIQAVAASVWGDSSNDYPTDLLFYTTPNAGATAISERMRITSAGNVGIGGDTTPDALLSVGSTSQYQVNSSGAIAAATGITSSGTITFSGLNTAGGVVYTDSSGVLASVAGTSGQCLISNGTSAPSWGGCSTGAGLSKWNITSGALTPINTTTDLLLGGTATASSRIALTGVNSGDTGITLRNSGDVTTLNSAGELISDTTLNLLSLGGNITLEPDSGAGTVTILGNTNLSSGSSYRINGTSVLSSTTLGSGVVNSSLTSVGALSSGSIASGFGTIATANTITGTTLNGTTGINTGAGAGTQRIDSSGALLNITDITASGTITFSGLNTAGGVVYTNGSGVLASVAGTTGDCLISNGTSAPSWGSCATGTTNYWQLNNTHNLTPGNVSYNVLLGSTATASANIALNADGSAVFNEQGLDRDFRIETDALSHAFFVDASTDRIGFGTSTPAYQAQFHAATGQADFAITTDVNVGSANTTQLAFVSDLNGTPSYASIGQYNTDGLRFSGVGNLVTPDAMIDGSGNFFIGGTSETLANTGFTMDGNDLYVAGMAGIEGGVYTDGSFVAGASTTYGNGTITQSSGETLTMQTTAAALTLQTVTSGNIVLNSAGTIELQDNTNVTGNFNASGTITLSGLNTAGGIVYTNGSGVLASVAGTTGDCLISNGTSAPSWSSCSSGSGGGYWNLASGTIFPVNSTLDLLVGGTSTASADFAFTNINSGTPTLTTTGNIIAGQVNGTTSVNTGSGTGTQRIDASGNFTNIRSINKGSTIPTTNDFGFYSEGTNNWVRFVTNNGKYSWYSNYADGIDNSPPTDSEIMSLDTDGSLDINGDLTTGDGGNYFTVNTAGRITRIDNVAHIIDDISGDLTLTSNSTNIDLADNVVITGGITASGLNTAGGVVYTNGSGVLASVAGTSGQCLLSNGTSAPSWGSCGSGGSSTSFWNLTSGVIHPVNSTADIMIGGTSTASAKFAFKNVNSGTPTLTIAGNLSLGTTAPIAKFEVDGAPSAGGNALAIFNNTSSSDILAASASGTTRFRVDTNGNVLASQFSDLQNSSFYLDPAGTTSLNVAGAIISADTITGTVLNGTTGINTGASAGTQRINSSGDMVNIRTITSSGTAPTSSDLGLYSSGSTNWMRFTTNSGDFKWFSNYTNGTDAAPSAGQEIMTLESGGILDVNGGVQLGASNAFVVDASGLITKIDGVAHTIDDISGDLRLTSNSSTVRILDALNVDRDLIVDTSTFIVDATTNEVNVGGDTTPDGLFTVGSTSQFTIGTDGNITKLGGAAHYIMDDGSGNLHLQPSGSTIELNGAVQVFSNLTVSTLNSAGGVIVSNGSGLLSSVAGTSGQCLLSNGTSAPSWGSCGSGGGGSSNWNVTAGALHPLNSTTDLLIGGTSTASADFAFTNINSGTPTLTTTGNIAAGAVNGTTSVNTGAGSGTVRIDANGNFLNLRSINKGSTVPTTSDFGFYSEGANNWVRNVSNNGRFRWWSDYADGIDSSPPTDSEILSLETNGELDISGALVSGTTDAFQVSSAGIITEIENVAHNISDVSGNLEINSNGTKVTITDDLQVSGNDILDSTGTSRITLGSTNTITGTASFTGSVGIGSTSPAGKLNIDSATAGNTTETLQRWGFSSSSWYLNLNQQHVSGSHLQWNWTDNSGNDLMKFDRGNVTIAGGSGSSQSVTLGGQSGTTTIYGTIVANQVSNISATVRTLCYDAASNTVLKSGSNGATCTVSSARYKQNIATTEYGLDTVLQLNPVHFNYKPEYDDGSGSRVLGFIAEEMESVVPEGVFYNDAGLVNGVHYDRIVPIAIKAIQELNAKVDNQIASASGSQNWTVSQLGQLNLTEQASNTYAVATPAGSPVTQLSAYASSVIGNLRAGLINAQKVVTTSLVALQRVETPEVNTNLISPVGDNDLTIGLQGTQGNEPATALNITGNNNETVASIDGDGNMTLAGQLLAQDVTTASLSADTIVTEEIDATSARIAMLEANMAELESIRANTAEIVNATVSGTLYADQIFAFQDKVANALKQPTLLEQLMGDIPQASSSTSLATLTQIVDVSPEFASGSASLNKTLADLELGHDDVVLGSAALFVNEYFELNGSGYIAQSLGIGNSLLIGQGTTIQDGRFEYIATADPSSTLLQIQSHGFGSINFLAGLMTLDDTGLVTINGDLNVAGSVKTETLLTNLITSTDFTNPFQVQVAGAATESGEVKESRFEIINELGTPVATISAQGKAEFAGGIGVGAEDISGAQGQITTTKTSGKATVAAGTNEVTIYANQVTSESLIYVTPLSSTGNKVLYVKQQIADNPATPENDSAFVVGFDNVTDQAVQFNWWIVN